ncbi:hypothetical protein [Kordiimonas sp.]|uniref:hypothetical protein n=1 Tax=Kordiimonas sp. TaxID=1970157 RepID=UPI003A8F528D
MPNRYSDLDNRFGCIYIGCVLAGGRYNTWVTIVRMLIVTKRSRVCRSDQLSGNKKNRQPGSNSC